MKHLEPEFACVSLAHNESNVADTTRDILKRNVFQLSCNPCSPDEVRGGSQCNPCNPCSPDQIRGGSQCNPCNPCSPDQIKGGTQCNPCNPCSPDQTRGGSQCNPCNPCSPDQMRGGSSGSSSGCFLTSACTESLGLSDDCDELETLRAFRDRKKLASSEFTNLVEEYYRIAPCIVARINALPERKDIYSQLYRDMVAPCVSMIKCGNDDGAQALYTAYVNRLKNAYC